LGSATSKRLKNTEKLSKPKTSTASGNFERERSGQAGRQADRKKKER